MKRDDIDGTNYNPYAIDWSFLPERALILKDYIRHAVVVSSNAVAVTGPLTPIWAGTIGRWTLDAIRSAKVLFIHIPKTGGTSISACLYGRNLPHYTADFYFRVFGRSLSAYPSFSVIRHPVERVISAYKMAVSGGTDAILYDRYDLLQLRGLESLDLYVDFIFRNRKVLSALPKALREQVSFIEDRDGRLLVDRVFPLESATGFPVELGQWLEIPHFPHLNATPPRDLEMSVESVEKIAEIYRRDFEMFDALTEALRGTVDLPAAAC